MLKNEDVEIHIGRAAGGDFMAVTHKPTGIARHKGPPLQKPGHAKREMLTAIENELIERGLTKYIVGANGANEAV